MPTQKSPNKTKILDSIKLSKDRRLIFRIVPGTKARAFDARISSRSIGGDFRNSKLGFTVWEKNWTELKISLRKVLNYLENI